MTTGRDSARDGAAGEEPPFRLPGDRSTMGATDLADAVYLAALWSRSSGGKGSGTVGDGTGRPGEENRDAPTEAGPVEDDARVRRRTAGGSAGGSAEGPTGGTAPGTGTRDSDRAEAAGDVKRLVPRLGGEGPALNDRQDVLAALAPLHIKEPRGPRNELDTEATARGYASALLDSLHWTREERGRYAAPVPAVARARGRRATELTLLVDTGASMLLQRGVVEAFCGIVRRSGAFRRVREVWFDSDSTGLPRPLDRDGRPLDTLGHGGVRAALVLTDGLGAGWYDPVFQDWLASVSGRAATAIVHLLHPRLWPRSALHTVPVRLRAPWRSGPAIPNTGYRVESVAGPPPRPGTAVPVLPLGAGPLHDWATFVSGRNTNALWASVAMLPTGEPAPPPAGPAGREALDLVNGFHRVASPEAFELAVALSAVPLEPAMVEAVCADVFGGPMPSELSEVFFGGLVRAERSEGAAAEPVSWDFRSGVRRTLLALGGRPPEIRRMLMLAADLFAPGDSWFADLSRVLRGEVPDAPADFEDGVERAGALVPAMESLSIADRFAEIVGNDRRSMVSLGSPEKRGTAPLCTESVFPDFRSEVGIESAGGRLTPPDLGERSIMVHNTQASGPISQMEASGGTRGRSNSAVWVQVPGRKAVFVGRQELLRSLRQKVVDGKRQVLTTLNGMSGVGKTELAKEYLYRYAEEYDLICWIPSWHESQLRDSFAELAEKIGVGRAGAGSGHVVHGVLEALRQGRPFSRWLLIFDNARSREMVKDYLPVDGDGHVIITSRDQSWGRDGADTFLPVTRFSREESIELLHRRGPDGLAVEDADRLASALGDLPLALNQAAVWLNEVGMDVSEYLRMLSEKHDETLGLLEPVDLEYAIPVAKAWNVSLDQLSKDNRAAIQLLQLCAFMDTTPIPRELFKFARGIDAPPELRRVLGDPALLGMAIRDVGRYSLADVDHRRNTISLHRLVRSAVQALMSGQEQERMRHCAHQLLACNDPQDDSEENIRRYGALLPHVWYSRAWDCEDPWVRELVVQLCRVAETQGEYGEALRFGREAHALWTDKLGPEHRDTLRMAVVNSQALRGRGELDRAQELCETTLRAIGEAEDLGTDSPEYLEAEKEHSRNLRVAGRFQESLEFSTENLARRVRLLGDGDPQTLTASHFLAFDLLLTGRVHEALEQYLQVWQRKEAVLGPDHLSTLGSIDGYADALMETGRYREAHEIQRSLADRLAALVGEDERRALALRGTQASMMRRAGMPEEAYELSAHVLERYRDKLGEESVQTLYMALSHSMALYGVRRYGEALDTASVAAGRYVKLLGENHPHVAAAEVNRAIILRRLDRLPEARELDERAMVLFQERLGPDHPSTLSCAVNLGNDRFRAGDTAGARESDGTTLERCRTALAENHPLTLLARRNLLMARWAGGEEDPVELDAVAAAYREVMGENHPATVSIRNLAREDADIYVGQL